MLNKKPLPAQSSRVAQMQAKQPQTTATQGIKPNGIRLGKDTHFDPESLPNGHILITGTSGSGKTQTLKGLAWDLHRTYSELQILLIDFHGDLALPNEQLFALNMRSPYGINPLTIDLDPKGGGPALQAIAVAAILRKSLVMGPNQEGQLIELFKECYAARGITQSDQKSWTVEPPNFNDLASLIESMIEDGARGLDALRVKLAATLQYGIFSRPQPPLVGRIIRFDLSVLAKVPGLVGIAAESIAKQLLDKHRLQGEISGKCPRTYLFIDEAKEMPKNPGAACDRISEDGRKYGLALCTASQSEKHFTANVIGNAATKIVLPVDQTDVKRVAAKFRFSEAKIADLHPLQALVRMGKDGYQVELIPYWQRIKQ